MGNKKHILRKQNGQEKKTREITASRVLWLDWVKIKRKYEVIKIAFNQII